MQLQVEHGRIQSVRIFGDFFATGDIHDVEQQMQGIPYTQDDLARILKQIDVRLYFGQITESELATHIFSI